MLTGFNTNIRHRSVLFHVQSEDSGRAHPHIITHLYHGGTIIHSEKSSYAARVDEANLEDVVRGLMEGQHKAVLKRLRAGEFDAAIRERLGDVLAASEGDGKAKTKPTETSPVAAAAPEAEPEAEREMPTAAQLVATTPASGAKGASGERPLDDVILGYLIENARKRRAK